MTLDDLAIDCIAELFQRDVQGCFAKLIHYYNGFSVQEMEETEVASISRRLVFSEVSNHLFKMYGDADPNLHKLIRNLKNVESSPKAFVKKIGDEWWICFGGEQNVKSSLPLMASEILEFYVTPLIAGDTNLRNFLNNLAEDFLEQTTYRNAFPLIGFARVLLSAFSRLDKDESSEVPHLYSLSEAEIKCYLAESIQTVKSDKHQTYVGKGKINEETYSTYFEVIADFLTSEYILKDGTEESLFGRLTKKIERLTEEQYETRHKTIVHYLLKETRAVFFEKAKKEL